MAENKLSNQSQNKNSNLEVPHTHKMQYGVQISENSPLCPPAGKYTGPKRRTGEDITLHSVTTGESNTQETKIYRDAGYTNPSKPVDKEVLQELSKHITIHPKDRPITNSYSTRYSTATTDPQVIEAVASDFIEKGKKMLENNKDMQDITVDGRRVGAADANTQGLDEKQQELLAGLVAIKMGTKVNPTKSQIQECAQDLKTLLLAAQGQNQEVAKDTNIKGQENRKQGATKHQEPEQRTYNSFSGKETHNGQTIDKPIMSAEERSGHNGNRGQESFLAQIQQQAAEITKELKNVSKVSDVNSKGASTPSTGTGKSQEQSKGHSV